MSIVVYISASPYNGRQFLWVINEVSKQSTKENLVVWSGTVTYRIRYFLQKRIRPFQFIGQQTGPRCKRKRLLKRRRSDLLRNGKESVQAWDHFYDLPI